MPRPALPRRQVYSTDINQLYSYDSLLILSKNSHFRDNKTKTTVYDNLKKEVPVNALELIIQRLQQPAR
jgi:hypothetical protein